MMYNNKLVCCIKSNNKILREFGEEVLIPFGSEFSILIKNLNVVRANVKVSIDGADIADGTSFIVAANGEIDLERFVRSNNLQQGNRFKFIERSEGIENHRGIKADDGLIRIEFQYEKMSYMKPTWTPDLYYRPNESYRGVQWTTDSKQWPRSGEVFLTTNCASGILRSSSPPQDIGITVPGSISDQQFVTTSAMLLESEKHVIILRLRGESKHGQQVLAPVTVKAKPKCITCGKINKATNLYCGFCGTTLTIL